MKSAFQNLTKSEQDYSYYFHGWKGGLYMLKRKYRGIGRGNSGYRKGKYYERKTRAILENQGYYTIRSGASKGIWDIVAIKEDSIKLIQVKACTSSVSKAEMNKMVLFKAPTNTTKELWHYYGSKPKICVL